ncbi:hypothetical protein FH972_022451 [Carpinus fangiana]|uniref:PHD-type domain-containing protein n=1 Tax=Carpinus fangiana TaxID=176857 RepID=A0A5N6KUJ5_9ROSI|nr:hypothetical protein FH972_022451 [Carpinus fangiana]
MEEIGMEQVYRTDSSDDSRPVAKAVGAREAFQPLPRSNPFHLRHMQQCESCGGSGSGARGQLLHCQGCSLSYHQQCLGFRNTRDHLTTKVGEANFILQCRRCVGIARRKEPTAPDQGICSFCHDPGPACHPFRERKSAAQEQRERENNQGEDPIQELDEQLVNNPDNVLFRCISCWRAFHFHHLSSKTETMNMDGVDDDLIAEERFREYSRNWECLDCETMPAKPSGIVAWRPINPDMYIPGTTVREVDEDHKEYLIKWDKLSYFRAQWMPGPWTWGVTASSMRIAFGKRDNGVNVATMNTEDAIPEDYLRIDIVLDVKFTSIVNTQAEEVDKARVREVDRALIKYKGLGYEDAVWETVPSPEDGDRWNDFVVAYEDWVTGRYVRIPKSKPLKMRLEKARVQGFSAMEKTKQPGNLTGGELMGYQLEGLNWLFYKWFSRANAILADEMGLGKTIQVIGLLATLVQDFNCFPFLIVVPNSTCPNWRREIKQWAPSLRAVAYYGSAVSRDMAYKYEMYPEASKELRCHVVVTSYDAAADDSCRRFFRGVPWQGMIVDEGQRLKNDQGLLYAALTALKAPFKLLLTGTPLQNNARELFNLLQFLDDSFNAQALELEYAELTKHNVPQLHDMIRPFFLRRTKAQVLTFLPPMAQIILPVSMSLVQRKLYMSILAKNPDLIRAIFDPSKTLKQGEKANLNNILMQLRKCLCHPFVYSQDIEDRQASAALLHRNLVEASSKLQLLEILLPKLKERGHRVLIFSQFLDMMDIIEDFLDGLALEHLRLDGNVGSLQKQKRIDEFNAPDSTVFAFVLSTRAGGVGINLATADTVIILDPDFNPHQDIQALSRAHRIGQKNKVLCFQLMTRSSAEEKIVQIGRRKMALDHVIVEQMDADEDQGVDVESVLRHGVADLLDETVTDIKYDDASVDKLLDRSQIENTKAGEDNSAESQFSFARVWANDTASLADSVGGSDDEERVPEQSGWDNILRERERLAAQEAAARQQILGRGKRARQAVDYVSKEGQLLNERGEGVSDPDSDTDFQEQQSEAHASADEDIDEASIDPDELVERRKLSTHRGILSQAPGPESPSRVFRRSNIVWSAQHMRGGSQSQQPPHDGSKQRPAAVATTTTPTTTPTTGVGARPQPCMACGTWHPQGYCPYKLAGYERCNLCGLAHFGVARTCPHIQSETQVIEMLTALKASPEQQHLVELATRYLRGVKGTLVQAKKFKAQRATVEALIAQGIDPATRGFNVQSMTKGSSHRADQGQQRSFAATPILRSQHMTNTQQQTLMGKGADDNRVRQSVATPGPSGSRGF